MLALTTAISQPTMQACLEVRIAFKCPSGTEAVVGHSSRERRANRLERLRRKDDLSRTKLATIWLACC